VGFIVFYVGFSKQLIFCWV